MDLRIIEDVHGKGIQTLTSIAAGERVIELGGKWVSTPSKYTIQLGMDTHLEPVDQLWALINHSCDPNLEVDPQHRVLIAARHIEAHEALTFNYLTTEWDMAAPFQCLCQGSNCFGRISGSRYLAVEQRKRLLVWQRDCATVA